MVTHKHTLSLDILLKNLWYNHSPGALLFLLMVRVSLKTPQPTATHVLGPEKKTRKSKRQNPIPMVSGCGHTRLLHLEYKLSLSPREPETRLEMDKYVMISGTSQDTITG